MISHHSLKPLLHCLQIHKYKSAPAVSHTPPKSLGEDVAKEFSMNGKIPIESYYVDDTNKGKVGLELPWSK